MTLHRSAATAVLALSALGLPSSDVRAQSITSGAVAGTVQRESGQPLGSVRLELRRVDGGLPVATRSGADGTFAFPLLEPGHYELLAERLGYRPAVLKTLPVRGDRRLDVTIALTVAEDVVRAPDTVAFGDRALAAGSRPGQRRSFTDWERAVPQRRGEIGELIGLSSAGVAASQVEGLPLSLSAIAAEGLPFRPAGGGDTDPLATLLFPVRSSGEVELVAGRPDVEWAGTAGAILSTLAAGEARGTGGEVGGMYSTEGLVAGPRDLPGYTSWRAGGSGDAFLVDDSAHIGVFGEGSRYESPVEFWSGRAGGVDAFETAGLNVASLGGRRAGFSTRRNAGGSFDWRFGGDGRVGVIALYGQGKQNHGLSGYSGVDVPAVIEGRDLFTATTAAGVLSERTAFQLRLGYGQSSREHTPVPRGGTGLGDAAVLFVPGTVQLGGDPAYPATFDRSAVNGQGTVHIFNEEHHVKLGGGFQLTSHDRTHVSGGAGLYLFDSPSGYAARSGVFRGVGGPRPSATFSVVEAFGYGQDTWRIGPGLDFTTGLRYELETLPAGELVRNQRWSELTGIDNTDVPASVGALTLVAGFDWDVREQQEWRVRADVAIQVGDVAPELLAEAVTHDGRVTATAAVGDVTAPTALGPRLTILSPELAPPLTTRASLGVSRALGRTAVLHLDGVLRQTDNLPDRVDLNLPAEAPYRDQYGRPVYGRLERVGSLLYPGPGTNRRFGEFDAVSSIASTASSTYWGITMALEKAFGGLRTTTSYTYSSTRDDWLAAPGGVPLDALDPFPGDGGVDDWADGVSDYDVPHKFVMATELTLPFAPMVTLGAFGRVESGRPFTPAFGRAVDANGDGVAGNDPAFIDGAIDGMDELQREWECLRASVDRFAARNECRLPTRQLLDVWLAVRIPGIGAVTPELRVEALGAVSEGLDSYDTALFRLDPDGALVTDEGAGEVTVPLMVNPRFGRALTPIREHPRFRISLRMAF